MTEPWRSRIVGTGEESPEQLLANPLNFRIHPKAQQAALSGALDQLGWIQQVLVNQQTGHVVDGHLRVELAISRGESTVPVVYVDLSPDEERLALLTLDPIAALAGQDTTKLGELLAEVEAQEPGLQAMLDDLARGAGIGLGPANEDDVPLEQAAELLAKWGVERGQVWELPDGNGGHRIMCGDSTNAQDVAVLLGGETPRLCVTDPPYGVDYDPNWRNEAAERGHIAHARRRVGDVTNDDRSDWSTAWALFPGDVIYCWHALLRASSVDGSLVATGFEVRMQIVWAKPRFAISRGPYNVQHEPCYYAVRKGSTAGWAGGLAGDTTLWEINLDRNVEGGHSTQKPVECMARPIRNHEGDVYDPFLGSGTTIVACHRLNRRGFGMELEPKYAAVSLERLSLQGLEPKLLTATP